MKTITALMMAIFLAMGMAATAVAGDDGVSARKARNAEMLTSEMEPHGTAVKENNVSATKRVDNLYMLLGELEPYGEGTQKQTTSVNEKTGMSPKKHNNLRMMHDEID